MNTKATKPGNEPTIEAALAATILDWAAFLRRHWLALVIVLIVAGSLGWAYTYRLPTIYQAKLKAMLYEPPRSISIYGGLLGLTDDQAPHLMLAQLYSQIGLGKAVLTAALDHPIQEGNLRDALNRTGMRTDDVLIRELRQAITITIQRRTHVLILTATYADPEIMPGMLAAVASAMGEHFRTQLQSSASFQRRIINTRLDHGLAQQGEAKKRLTEFDREHAGKALTPEEYLKREELVRDFVAMDELANQQKHLRLKADLAAVAETHVGTVIEILEAPQLPRRPAGPPRVRIMLIAIVIGLGLGVLYLRAYDAVRRFR